MKKEKGKNNKTNQSPAATPEVAFTEMEWFGQFENMPGIDEVYTPKELNLLKKEMLSNLKKKINELD